MYNSGNSSKNVTGASVVDGTLENADYADNGLSGDKIDGGIISNFQSTGIDDRLPTGKVLTLSDTNTKLSGSISFNGDTAAANALDDYEEGTFTATLASGATTTPTATGYYTKIGRRVNVLLSNDFGSVTVNGTALTISGLPFAAPASNTKARAAGAMGGTARVQHQAASESFWEIAEATSTLSAKYMLANAGGSTALLTEASGTYTPSYQVNISYIVD